MRFLITQFILLILITRISYGQDLTITSLSVPSTSLSTGSYFYPNLQVRNAGLTSAGSSSVGFYLSADTNLTVTDTYLGNSTVSSLASGSSTLLSPGISIASTVANGTYYLFAYADYAGTVSETNESNNSRFVQVTVSSPIIDLTVTSQAASSASTSAGEQVTLTCVANNKGNVSASSVYVGFYISTDSVYSSNDTYLTYASVGSLSAGASYTVSASTTIPSSISNGNYYIVYYIDYSGYVTEANENNNTRAKAMSVTAPNYVLVPYSGTNTITTCSTTVYDHGGANGTYSSGASGALTIYPAVAGNYVTLNFTSLAVETCCDYVSVYDGTSTSATLIGSYYYLPSTVIYATNSSGALTLRFYSDGSSVSSGFSASVACVATVPKPDLKVAAFSITNTSLLSNAYSYPSLVEYNVGNAQAASHSIGFYLSTDTSYSIGDTYLGSYSMGALAAGGSYTTAPSVFIPSTTSAGQYYLIAMSDYNAAISESNENNNTRALRVTVVPSTVDLRISSLSATLASVVPGGSIYPSVYELNQGNSTSGSHYIGYYLSTDTVHSVGDTYLTSSYISSLSANASTYMTPTITIPASILPGAYYLLAVADYNASISETSENNNSKYLPVTIIQPNVDLKISSFSLSNTSVVGGTYLYPTVYELNSGTTAAYSHTVGYYLSSDSVHSVGDTYLTYSSVSTLSGGLSSSLAPSLYIPTSLLQGDYYLIAVADNSSSVTETNENNNSKAVKIKVVPANVDLRISSFSGTLTSALPGGSIYVTAYEQNIGNTYAASNYVGYYLSADSVYSVGDTYITSSYISSVAAGSSSYVYTGVTIPSNTLPGSYYLVAVADYSNYITEGNEANNARPLAITVVQPNVDLRISSFSLNNTSYVAGGYVYPTVYEFNAGTTSASSHYIGYYLSSDSVYSVGDTYLTSSSLSSVAGGSSVYVTPSIYLPTGLISGTYYIVAVADYSGILAETNENNNAKSARITIDQPFVDLKISSFSASLTSATAGDYIYTTVYEQNAGNTLAGSNYVGFYLSTDSIYSIGDTYLTYTYMSSLAAGSSTYASPSIQIPSATLPGNYYLIAVADYNSQVVEFYEGNNTRALRVSVLLPNVDLRISSVALTNTAYTAGSYVYPTVYEINAGTTLSPSHSIGYYLSSDSVYSVGDTYLSSSSMSTLAAGTTTYTYPSIYLPSTLLSGQYYLISVSDYSSVVTETNENNNTRATKISIAPAFIDLKPISVSTFSTALNPGTSVSLNVTVQNAGNIYSSSYYMGYYLSTDSVYSASDVQLTYATMSSLSAGSSVLVYPSFVIPASTLPGNYYIITVCDYSNAVVESNESNNTKALKIAIVLPNVDLRISALSTTSTSVASGNYINANVTELNAGTTAAAGHYIGYYLSADSTLNTATDTYLSSSYVNSLLGSSSTGVLSASVYVPTTVANGQYYLIAAADYSAYVVETNENNNYKSVRISVVAPIVDLKIASVTVDTKTVVRGSYVSAYVTQQNIGTITSGSSYTGYYLSTDSVYSVGDTYLTSAYVSSVSPLTNTYVSSSIFIPTSVSLGNYYIVAIADYNNYLIEANEGNNTRAIAITVTLPDVDLQIGTNLLPQASVAAGNYVYPTIVERNTGTTTAPGGHTIQYYLSKDSVYQATDTYLATSYMGYISGGTRAVVQPGLFIPAGLAIGQYYIIALADFDNVVVESNESNNTRASRLTITAPSVDLRVLNFSLPKATFAKGESFTSTMLVSNVGTTKASAHYEGFYLSKDTILNAADVLLGYGYASEIAYNDTLSVSASLEIPVATVSGSYYLIGVADYLLGITESNEANNTKAYKINVSTVTDIEDQAHEEQVTIYPNPSTGMVNVGRKIYGEATVEVQDLAGQRVYESILIDNMIDLSSLPQGAYVVKIKQAENYILTEKLVITK